jgi:hypothetical protein
VRLKRIVIPFQYVSIPSARWSAFGSDSPMPSERLAAGRKSAAWAETPPHATRQAS